MKRSEINAIIRNAASAFAACGFKLPPFAYWTAEDWHGKGHEYDEIRDNMLGWDITDFGSGKFHEIGLVLFTLRNGQANATYPKPYAEKVMLVGEGQVTPFHFHWNKMEDIINRGGGVLCIQLYNSTEDEQLADTPVQVQTDGHHCVVEAGSIVELSEGESITLLPGVYHKFWGKPGCGQVVVGEVSKVNDDRTDNRFLEQVGRFPAIEEDEPAEFLLCSEYPPAAD